MKRADALAARKRRRVRDTGPSPAVRKLVLDRDGFLCVRCGISVAGRPRSIHHRIRRSQCGSNAPENLITLCPGCHGWVHGNIAEARASGWLLLGTGDPAAEGVLYASEHGSGMTLWLTRAGKLSTGDPGEAAA